MKSMRTPDWNYTDYANTRLAKLRPKLADLHHSHPTEEVKKAIRSTTAAIKRWEKKLREEAEKISSNGKD